MIVLHFLSAVTTDLPAGIEYPVVGTAYELTCTYGGSDFTPDAWEWFKDGVKVTGAALQTYSAITDGDYHCVADDGGKKSAATPAITLKFHGKHLLIHYLNSCLLYTSPSPRDS